jgi:putative ABC transport system permease protein
VVVVSHAFWRNHLGADPAVIGRIAYVDRKPVTIAGVASAAVPGLDYTVPDVFLPIEQRDQLYPQGRLLRSWDDEAVDMYARLAPGVTVASAREAMRAIMRAASAEHPQIRGDEWLEPL